MFTIHTARPIITTTTTPPPPRPGERLLFRDQPHLRAPVRWMEVEVLESSAATVRVRAAAGGIFRAHVGARYPLGADA